MRLTAMSKPALVRQGWDGQDTSIPTADCRARDMAVDDARRMGSHLHPDADTKSA